MQSSEEINPRVVLKIVYKIGRDRNLLVENNSFVALINEFLVYFLTRRVSMKIEINVFKLPATRKTVEKNIYYKYDVSNYKAGVKNE